ncbi:hypothetical protein [Plantactinospora sp. KLBMP9567]|uniref:hypothetical protein n=1 Tax=Plantactinospora sp. KLBMP9567 TaxID=3085900 RepID=UPI0029825A0A|nr:hypothetical protein [Plantactinospora sp. KLBMP9567]MDW5328353.1 hypothetical protein [Plantactinospora sp. KLBMP9567]
MLSLLAVRVNTTVSVDEFVAELWAPRRCTCVNAVVSHDREYYVSQDNVGAQAAGVLDAANQFGRG